MMTQDEWREVVILATQNEEVMKALVLHLYDVQLAKRELEEKGYGHPGKWGGDVLTEIPDLRELKALRDHVDPDVARRLRWVW